jgi:hypothetical protein
MHANNANEDNQRSAAEYVEAIMRNDRERAMATSAAPPAPRRRLSQGSMLSLLPILVGLSAWNLAAIARPRAVFTADEERSAARFYVYLTANAVDAHEARTGSLPASLAEIGLGDDGVDYSIAGRTYVLSASTRAGPVSYRAGDDLQPFANEWDRFRATPP